MNLDCFPLANSISESDTQLTKDTANNHNTNKDVIRAEEKLYI